MNQKIRILIAKPGLDGHDRGAKVIAKAFRDAGMEVIYTGLHQTAEMIVQTAADEDVDVVGLSILSGAHNEIVPAIIEGLKKEGLEETLVILGGIIPEEDREPMLKAGVSEIFPAGSSLHEMVDFVRNKLAES